MEAITLPEYVQANQSLPLKSWRVFEKLTPVVKER